MSDEVIALWMATILTVIAVVLGLSYPLPYLHFPPNTLYNEMVSTVIYSLAELGVITVVGLGLKNLSEKVER